MESDAMKLKPLYLEIGIVFIAAALSTIVAFALAGLLAG
jgi:hypothetical protein